MIEGIDVSKWQGAVHWASVAADDIRFGIARSSLGMQTHDETFATNYKNATRNGLVSGAYHVVAADSTGAQQASNWKAALDAAGFDKGLLVLDVEAWSGTTGIPAATVLANVEYLCNWIRDTYKRTPIIYTGVYWRETLKQHPDNFGSKLWLAAYTEDPTRYIPTAWDDWDIWQYTSSGYVAGVSGNVDRNKYDGTVRSLKGLAGWEWDELATREEIRTVVREEVAALIAADNANAEKILAATAESRNTVAQAVSGGTAAVQGSLDKQLRDLYVNLSEMILNLDNDQSVEVGEELKQLINKLHRHLCLPCTADSSAS